MLNITYVATSTLIPNPRNARTHSNRQIGKIIKSIKAFDFRNPIWIDAGHMIWAGHGRWEAAKKLGLAEVPAILLNNLTEPQKRALMIAENQLASEAGWDREKLAIELPELAPLLLTDGIDITVTGFEFGDIEQIVVDFENPSPDPAENPVAPAAEPAATKPGDIWLMGNHRLICGNARMKADIDRLMNGARCAMAFMDPPYNVAISSVVGRGVTKHREFAEAVGEMTFDDFVSFLNQTLGNVVDVSMNGALHYVCMDWTHMGELLAAAKPIYGKHVNTCIWTKSNAGQGSFYRSAHEQIGVFRVGDAPHANHVNLGRHGRSRSNVWPYAGLNSFGAGRMDALASHPTVKPVALVSDAMRDCTRRGDIVVDVFCGSGTTILAAEKVGRVAYGLEIDPLYVDLAIRRWQEMTGKDRYVRAVGWSSTVMGDFLTLCERSGASYPAEQFADQILSVLDGSFTAPLRGWRGTFLAARIASLVQQAASRETPLPSSLGQKLLRILDVLVDMGDRRSAALQHSETFREVRLPSEPIRDVAIVAD